MKGVKNSSKPQVVSKNTNKSINLRTSSGATLKGVPNNIVAEQTYKFMFALILVIVLSIAPNVGKLLHQKET
jgi:hypothetical protein